MAIRTAFVEQLIALHNSIKQMGVCACLEYSDLFKAVRQEDTEAVEGQIQEKSSALYSARKEIEATCVSIIVRQQPIAGDLRTITSSLEIVRDLYRIGEVTSDMAELVLRLKLRDLSQYAPSMEEMVKVTGRQLTEVIAALGDRDAGLANKVIGGDDLVDDLFNRVKMELIDGVKKERISADDCVDVLMIAKYLEKTGDHAVSIAEWIIYQEGGDVKESTDARGND